MRKFFLALIFAFAACATASVNAFAVTDNQNDESASLENLSDSDIIKICNFYLSTPPNVEGQLAELRNAAAQAIIVYGISTNNFTLEIGDPVTKLILADKKNDDNSDLLVTYLAGETLYCLEHKLNKNDAASFASAMEKVMNYYSQLPKRSSKKLNKYLKMSESERHAAFEKLFNSTK